MPGRDRDQRARVALDPAMRRSLGAWIARETVGFTADWDVWPTEPEDDRRDAPEPVRIVLLDADQVRAADSVPATADDRLTDYGLTPEAARSMHGHLGKALLQSLISGFCERGNGRCSG